MKIMTVFYIFFIYDEIFFDFLKALPMKKIFQEHETNVDYFYSLFVAFDNFYQIISLKFFYFRSLLEEYQLRKLSEKFFTFR